MRLLRLTMIGVTALALTTAQAAEKKAEKPAQTAAPSASEATIDLAVSGMT